MDSVHQFAIGDLVQKKRGYLFRGYIVAIFYNRENQLRVVVENQLEVGMLHIFSPAQLELITCA